MKPFFLTLTTVFLLAQSAWAEAIPVTIITTQGDVTLSLEVASTPTARELGLMKRKALNPHDGMLFVFPKTERLAFWMKDTLIPLDMIFIDAKGRVVRVAENAVPFSLEEIDSQKPIRSVIEIDGGRAEKEGIAVGDKVDYSLPEHARVE